MLLLPEGDDERIEAMLNFEFLRHRVKLEISLRSFDFDVTEFMKDEFRVMKIKITQRGEVEFEKPLDFYEVPREPDLDLEQTVTPQQQDSPDSKRRTVKGSFSDVELAYDPRVFRDDNSNRFGWNLVEKTIDVWWR